MKQLEISRTDLKSLPENNSLSPKENTYSEDVARGKRNGFRHFFLYCTFQELCNSSSFDKQIHPQDKLGFQEESSTKTTTWIWAGYVHGNQRCREALAALRTDGPAEPQNGVFLHSF